MAIPKEQEKEEVVFEYTPEPAPASSSKAKGNLSATPGEGASVSGKSRGEYEAIGYAAAARSYEPPEQRLLRLQSEVADLLQLAEAQNADDSLKGNSHFPGGDPAAVASELRILEQRLGGLARDGQELWKAAPDGEVSGARAATADALASQLERLAAAGSPAAARLGLGGAAGDGRVTYEINYAPSSAAVADSSKIAALEGSLAGIEKQLGVFEQACPFADLQTAVMQLQRRLSALDNQKLDTIRTGVHKTMLEVEAVLEKKRELEGTAADLDLDRKATELFEFCHRWSAVAPVLPTIISRLQSLQVLHQESASYTTRLAQLEQQQEELAKLLETTSSAVQDLGKSLQDNVKMMKESMTALEGKITKAVQS